MTIKKGATILVAFKIDGRAAMATVVFTGRYATLEGTEIYQLENVNNGNTYYFNQEQIAACAEFNDPSLMGEVEELTI
jgi:hypothetical protein